MDVKEQIEKVVSSITGDPNKVADFQKDPIAAVKKVAGNLPTDVIDKIVAAVKAKLGGGKLADAAGALGGLFGK